MEVLYAACRSLASASVKRYTPAMKIPTVFLLAAAAMSALGDDAANHDTWPRFRGPNGNGISDAATVPATWTENDYNWKIQLPGGGHSSPVIWKNRLFVTCADDATAKRFVLCLDAGSGRTLWQREYPSQSYHQNKDNSYASSTPACDADGVVVTWSDPDHVMLLALNNDGREVWRRDFGPFVGAHGSAVSPIIADDLVILHNDQEDPAANPNAYTRADSPKSAGKSFVVAVDRGTGKTHWQLDRRSGQSSYSTPCVRGGELILCSTMHGISGVDLATGRLRWELPGVFDKRCVASPVLANDLVISSCGAGGVGSRVVAVRAGTAPEKIYQLEKPVPYVPTALVKGERLFLWGDNGTVSCHKVTNGELIWRERVSGAFYGSPVWIHGRLYNVSKSGDVFVLSAGDSFELLGRIPLGEKCHASPAVAHGALYLRTYSQLFSVGGRPR